MRCLDAGCEVLFTGAGSYCGPHKRARKRIRNADRPIARAVVAASPVCAWCGATEDLTADHVDPLAGGGTNEGERQTLCRVCNSAKGTTGRCHPQRSPAPPDFGGP